MNKVFIQLYRTTNGYFASVIIETKKTLITIKLKKAYKTEKSAKKAIEDMAKQMGFLK